MSDQLRKQNFSQIMLRCNRTREPVLSIFDINLCPRPCSVFSKLEVHYFALKDSVTVAVVYN